MTDIINIYKEHCAAIFSGKSADRHCGRHGRRRSPPVGAGMKKEWFENAIAAAGFVILGYVLLSLPGY